MLELLKEFVGRLMPNDRKVDVLESLDKSNLINGKFSSIKI